MRAALSQLARSQAHDLPGIIALQLQLLQRMRDGLAVFDESGEIRLWNSAAAVITGWDPRQALQNDIVRWESGVLQLRPGLWLDVCRFSCLIEGREHAAMLFSDCSSQVALREMRERLGADPITGIATRGETLAHLERALALGRRERRAVGVLYVAVDDIAAIKGRYGLAAATEVLIRVGERLKRHVRKSDLVGRVAHDEFAVVLTAMRERYHARIAAVRLLLAVAQPIRADGKLLSISCSVGVAEATEVGSDASTLYRRAYDAMLNARRFGGGFVSGVDDRGIVPGDAQSPLVPIGPSSAAAPG